MEPGFRPLSLWPQGLHPNSEATLTLLPACGCWPPRSGCSAQSEGRRPSQAAGLPQQGRLGCLQCPSHHSPKPPGRVRKPVGLCFWIRRAEGSREHELALWGCCAIQGWLLPGPLLYAGHAEARPRGSRGNPAGLLLLVLQTILEGPSRMEWTLCSLSPLLLVPGGFTVFPQPDPPCQGGDGQADFLTSSGEPKCSRPHGQLPPTHTHHTTPSASSLGGSPVGTPSSLSP